MTERQRRAFWRLVYQTLDPGQQRALLGHVLDGKTYAQIAREVGVHRSTILRRARAATALLRVVLRPFWEIDQAGRE